MSGGRPLRVVYQGVRGSYCQEAAAASFSGVPTTRLAAFPCTKMEDAFVALEDGDADRAVVPAENSLDGPIHRNLDLLLRHPAWRSPASSSSRQPLPPRPSRTPLAALNGVASHPQALAHCCGRIADLGLEAMGVVNAADAARALAEGGSTLARRSSVAALPPRSSAWLLRRRTCRAGLFSVAANYTRFLQLALRSQGDRHRAAAGRRKATVAFSLEEGPSALHRAMRAFESHGLTVTRVDHRPNARALSGRQSGPEHRRSSSTTSSSWTWRMTSPRAATRASTRPSTGSGRRADSSACWGLTRAARAAS
ncbi:unnamed protein product [Spirodela intermedia]|uniref:Prephenate dehydratase domain-containing protein n=1 Tax=Spirodela intermedia TaxID=51605 RepID=A0A7I8J2X7_SPIIN|nr:unnamed protein product [Spirodela intermedia]CAA6663690.1 unnamed protein product [Spirodela intermedia]